MPRGGFRINTRELDRELGSFNDRMNKGVAAAMDYQATRSEISMKTNARWTDRTGNARGSLFTATKHEGTVHEMVLSHGMSYGIWLEVRFSGRYAIVRPTIPIAAAELKALISKIMKNLPKG